MTIDVVLALFLLLVFGLLLRAAICAMDEAAGCKAMLDVIAQGFGDINPYAYLLGKTVEAKVYAESDWERMVIVAVSWHGSVCVRRESDLETMGRWIKASQRPTRVREIEK